MFIIEGGQGNAINQARYMCFVTNRKILPEKKFASDEEDDEDQVEEKRESHLEVRFFSVSTFYYLVSVSACTCIRESDREREVAVWGEGGRLCLSWRTCTSAFKKFFFFFFLVVHWN